ncbi:MAG: hypothetical protein Q4E59_03125 [Bacteroidales bacterium]|nr:hypothetical protein [Bacteroidales bacterium]
MKKFTLLLSLLFSVVGTMTSSAAVDELEGLYFGEAGAAATELTPGEWYLVYNNGRSGYIYDNGTDFYLAAAAPTNVSYGLVDGDWMMYSSTCEDVAGYLIRLVATDTEGEYYIQDGLGNYLTVGSSSSAVSTEGVAFTITAEEGSEGIFYLCDTSTGYYVNGNPAGSTLVGWGTSVSATGSNGRYSFYPVTTTETGGVSETLLEYQTIQSYGDAITSTSDISADTWYALNIAAEQSRSGYIYYNTSSSNYYNAASLPAVGTTTDTGGLYLFKLVSTGEEGYYYIQNASGYYFTVGSSSSAISTEPEAFYISHIDAASDSTVFYALADYLIDTNGNGSTVVGWGTSAPTAISGSNSALRIYPVTLGEVTAITVTLNYYIDGELYSSASSMQALGEAPTYSAPINYVAFSSCDVDTVDNSIDTINVYYVSDLPFTVSESYDNATWYLIDMHSNDSGTSSVYSGENKYLWTYVADSETYNVQLPIESIYQLSSFDDTYLWCFVGNVVDGFTIYNKAAGDSMVLNKEDGNSSIATMVDTASATNSVMQLVPSTGISGATCFLPVGHSSYVNTQIADTDGDGTTDTKVLLGWTAADGGSSCFFHAPAEYFLSGIDEDGCMDMLDVPTNALGYPVYLTEGDNYETLAAAYDSVEANPYDLEAIALLDTCITGLLNSDLSDTTIDPNAYYRLINKNNGHYLAYYMNDDGQHIMLSELEGAEANSVVRFVETDTEGQYYMYMDGMPLSQIVSEVDIELQDPSATDSIAIVEISSTGTDFSFQDVSEYADADSTYRFLHLNIGYADGWTTEDTPSSLWYVVPATTVEINVNAAGTTYYTTTYLPFAVTLPDGVSAYTAVLNEADSEVVATEVEGTLPPATGYIIVSSTDSVVLNIQPADSSTEEIESNDLIGSYAERIMTTSDELYVPNASDDDEFVFSYLPLAIKGWNLDTAAAAANVAYLNSISGIETLTVNFTGIPTGIKSAVSADADEAAGTTYDLSGRAVRETTAKGLYIKNGKKVYVK